MRLLLPLLSACVVFLGLSLRDTRPAPTQIRIDPARRTYSLDELERGL